MSQQLLRGMRHVFPHAARKSKAQSIQFVWASIPDFKMGSISLNDFNAAVTAADALVKQHSNSAVEQSGLKANRDDKVRELNDLATRFLSGIRSHYGPDSALYEQAGGTRKSLRKSPKRQAATPPATSNASAAAQHA